MKNGRRINPRRKYSEDFKMMVVREYERGEFSVKQLSKLHDIAFGVIYKWIYKYSTYNQPNTQVVEKKNSSSEKLKAYEKRIKELERAVGSKQMQIEYLSEIIELANKHYKVDLKKTLGCKQ